MAQLKSVRFFADLLQYFARFQSRSGCYAQAGGDATLETRNANHEKLVKVRGENSQKIDSFEQKHVLVFGQLEYTLVECQPAELAVEKAIEWHVAVVGQVDRHGFIRRHKCNPATIW